MPRSAGGLWYEVRGSADASPLILSAGLGGSARYWEHNIGALAKRFRVIAYDHRGTGRSDRRLPEVLAVEDMAEDILGLMDELGIAKAHVTGHAAGGIAGLALALIAPHRLDRLVVVNGWGRADPHFLRCFEARLTLLRCAGPEAYLRAQPIFLFPANWVSLNSAIVEAELPGQLLHFPGVETMEKRVAALAAFDIQDRLGEIETATLLYCSADDMLVPSICSSRLADHLPNATEVTVRYGGHACNVTDPEDFNQFVGAWLAGEDFAEE